MNDTTDEASVALLEPASPDQIETPGDADLAIETTAETQTAGEQPQIKDEDYDIELADGTDIAPDVVDDLKSLARELGLPRDATQRVADLGQKLAERWMTRLTDSQAEARRDWADTARNDREFGGDRLDENLSVARAALNRFSTPHLTHMLDVSGLGNHPEVIRAFYRIGKAISEDRFVTANTAPGSVQSAAAKLYPNLPQG